MAGDRAAQGMAWGLTLAGSLAVVLHTFVSTDGWPRRSRLARDLLARQSENTALEEQAAALRADIAALNGRPEAQEHIIRDELGWVRPGDVIIHFDPPAD